MSDDFKRAQLDYYDTSAADYETGDGVARTLNRGFARKARIIAGGLRGTPGKSLLEVGAGSGLLTWFLVRQLQSQFERYDLLDLSQAMLDRAKARLADPRLRYVAADAAATGLPEGQYDLIVGCDIIHHLDDPVAALREWRRLARPGARLAILETNPWNPLHLRFIGVEHEQRSWLNTDANLRRWMQQAGWSDVQVAPAPAFTPPGPRFLGPLLDLIDRVSLWIPGWRRLTALWLLTARK